VTERQRRLVDQLVVLAGWSALAWWTRRASRLEFDRQLGATRALLETERLERRFDSS
jgi:hypothetical protein